MRMTPGSAPLLETGLATSTGSRVVLGKGQRLPAVVEAAKQAPFQGGVRRGGEAAQRRGVAAVAGDLLGEELIAQGEHVQGLVDVVRPRRPGIALPRL